MTDETTEPTWLTDANGNHASIEYFGSREAAQAALDSLKNCENCTNCSRCSRCSDCSRCSRCSGCSGCSRCSDCSRCSRCSGCSDCSGCSHIASLRDKENIRVDNDSGIVTRDVGMPPVPRIEDIHRRIYLAVQQPGAFDMSNWHKCETTHCRAGWVVHLAGAEGYALEKFHNTELAAMLIYRESGYYINPAKFYDDNEAAMEDMRKLADAQS